MKVLRFAKVRFQLYLLFNDDTLTRVATMSGFLLSTARCSAVLFSLFTVSTSAPLFTRARMGSDLPCHWSEERSRDQQLASDWLATHLAPRTA